MCNGTSIRHALTSNQALPGLALQAANSGAPFVGFFFDHSCEEWNYWTVERADATASNTYYTPEEIRALLRENGFPAE